MHFHRTPAKENGTPIVWPADGRWVTLTGRIVVEAEVAPTLQPIEPSRDVSHYPLKIPNETLVVHEDNMGVANVFVWIEPTDRMPTHPGYRKPTEPIRLRFENGRLRPHALFANAGQELVLGNRDPLQHIVAMGESPSFKVPGGDEVVRRLAHTPEPMSVRCQFHPWMGAFILVQDHPWTAVTDTDGRFRIDRIPAGDWWLRIWHEEIEIDYTIDESGFGHAWEQGRRKLKFDRPEIDLGELSIECTLD